MLRRVEDQRTRPFPYYQNAKQEPKIPQPIRDKRFLRRIRRRCFSKPEPDQQIRRHAYQLPKDEQLQQRAAQDQPDFARSYYNEALSIDPTDSAALQAIASLDRGASDQRAANTEGSQTRTP